MQKKVVLKGAAIVLAASIVIRILGFLFRTYIAEQIGPQGMGVYQLIVSLYMMVATFATSGIMFSVSRMVSETYAKDDTQTPNDVLKISILWTVFLSLTVSILLFMFAKQIGLFLLREPQTINSVFFIAPAIPFMAVSACFKGYFYALRKATHPSTAGIVEQIFKMIFIMSLIGFFLTKGTPTACAIISIGMAIGEIASAIYLSICFFINKNKLKPINKTYTPKSSRIFKDMLKISVPIQFSSTFNAALRLLEGVLIIECFKIFTHGDGTHATSTYGIIRGMAMPLILFPTSFLQSIVTVLVPELSSANVNKQKRTIRIACEKALQLTFFLGILSSAMFFTFSNQISSLFYSNKNVSLVIKSLSILCPFMYTQLITMGILNALGEQIATMKFNIIDAVFRIILILILIPKGGFKAFVAVMYISNIVTCFLFINRLFKITALPFDLNRLVFKPTIAIIFATVFSASFQPAISNLNSKWIQMAALGSITSVVFIVLLICFKCVNISQMKPLLKLSSKKQNL